MRAPALALAFLVLAVVLTPPTTAEDWGAVGKVNKLISVRASPELAPGDTGRFEFYFNSTYSEPMIDVTLNASIYRYATIDESVALDSSWPYAYPKIAETGTRAWSWAAIRVDPGSSRLLNFTVATAANSRDMPHGSIFSQSSYFVRFSVDFEGNVSGTMTPFRMASRGFFTEAQWNLATSANATNPCTPPACRGNVNLTVLGVDGLLPDSAFGVKEPIPRWPFYLLIGLAALFLVLAFLFWVEENPGSYPRVDTWWARTRGRLARTIAPLGRRRRDEKGFYSVDLCARHGGGRLSQGGRVLVLRPRLPLGNPVLPYLGIHLRLVEPLEAGVGRRLCGDDCPGGLRHRRHAPVSEVRTPSAATQFP